MAELFPDAEPGSWKATANKLQSALRRATGVTPAMPGKQTEMVAAVPSPVAEQKTPGEISKEVTVLRAGTSYEMPENLPAGTVIVFGRGPNAEDPKYTHFGSEVGVKLTKENGDDDPKMSRRTFGLRVFANGTYSLVNLTPNVLRYGKSEGQNIELKGNEEKYLGPTDDLGNLRIEFSTLDSDYKIRVQSTGGGTGKPNSIRSLAFIGKPH